MALINEGQDYLLHHGDCIEHMATMPPTCIDFSVFSPPFPSLFAYTSLECDMGNSDDLRGEARLHLSFFYRQLARVLKPGRVAIVHVMQIPRLKRSGESGTFDYRGMNIRLGERAGLIYNYDWLVNKNPQTEAIRTKSHALQFASMDRDKCHMHGQMGDYLIKFRAPGENKVPVRNSHLDSPVSRQEWIDWAESSWPWRGPAAVRQTLTLNVKEGRGEDDVKHICPLQLDVIERVIRMYTNPGDVVFSPFAGIGSEGYVALLHNRRFYGCEIKDEYIAAAKLNCDRAIEMRTQQQQGLFSDAIAETHGNQ
jgi:DNA modification methylase